MPFDPNRSNPDRSPGGADSFELPDELACLGEQLEADAAYLASRYPAPTVADSGPARDRPMPPERARRQSFSTRPAGRRTWYVTLAAVALVLLICVTLPHVVRWGPPQPENHPAAGKKVAVRQPSADGPVVAESPAGEKAKEPGEEAGQPADNLRWPPALLFQEATAPELEALLDLLESEDAQDATLSI